MLKQTVDRIRGLADKEIQIHSANIVTPIFPTFTIKHFYYYDTKGGKLLKRCARRGKYSHKMRSQTIVGIVSLVSLQIFKNTLRNPSSFARDVVR